MKGWAISMGIGIAAGAVAAMMLPRQSSARRLINKAANATQNAVNQVANKLSDEMNMH